MDESGNKTIICSVLFLDISEYSRKQVAEQISLKEGFNSFLSRAIRNVPINDRIILDTGDGAAISFLGDVGDAIKVALSLRESFFQEGVLMTPPLLVRMGINLGPVRLVKDINGQPNIVGDGINVAQRIMGFADTGQILVSRSYYDAVSRLSQEYAGMFHYQGSRTDKHVREHEIYAIGYPGELTNSWKVASGGAWRAVRSAFQDASAMRRTLYIGMPLAALVLLVAALVKVLHQPAAPLPPVEEAPVQAVIAPAVSGVAEVLPKTAEPETGKSAGALPQLEKKPAAASTPEKKPVVSLPLQQPVVAAAEEKKPQIAHEEPRQAPAAKETPRPPPAAQEGVRKLMPTMRTLEETTAVEPGAAALVNLAVTPWGEIYLDGRMQGVSPPLTGLQVAPGKHEIEIRNTTFPPYIQKIEVKANEKIKLIYKFTN
ncbi:MAG: PEGA domain-containing protein [Nitrosomonadales bacterium]|nr:PEGA domain-containing protein [Nitrosomonadales bacterium]